MFRTIMMSLSIGTLALLGTVAIAKPHDKCGGKLKVLINDVDLTTEQKELLGEIKDSKQEMRKERKDSPRKSKDEWMMDYLEGAVDRADVRDQIDSKHQKKDGFHQDMQVLVLDLLETYTDTQREQVLDNIEDAKECHQEKKAEYKARVKEHKEGRMEMLTKDLELSKRQERELEEFKSVMKEYKKELKVAHKESREVMIEDFVAGEINRSEANNNREDQAEDMLSFHHEKADLWMNFLDGLSKNQKKQMLRNLEEMEQHRAERKEEQRGRR